MKDFEYKDQPGFENINTPTAEDIFELSSMMGMKDRYIHDLSTEPRDIVLDPLEFGPGFSSKFYKNLAYWTSEQKFAVANGVAENSLELIGENENYTFVEHNGVRAQDNYGNDLTVPLFSEKTAGYMGAGVRDAFGTQGKDNRIGFFRSGYIEFTIKIEKSNCIIFYGSKAASYIGPDSLGLTNFARTASWTRNMTQSLKEAIIDSSTALTNEPFADLNEIGIYVSNGKLQIRYEKPFGNNKISYSMTGNKQINDGNWHHIVVNFNKEGMIREGGKKINSKPIEFWIDGKLDKKSDELRTKKQIFFPALEWIGVNPLNAFGPEQYAVPLKDKLTNWKIYDSGLDAQIGDFTYGDDYQEGFPYAEFRDANYPNAKLASGIFNESSLNENFSGAIHTVSHGFNIPLSKSEIEERYNLYFKNSLQIQESLTAKALMLEPKVSGNKPKALKLFWNNLILENAKDGLELDSNFNVHSYSVTHKTVNSPSDIYNIDVANDKELKFLQDVRFALTDNIVPFAPGAITDQNYFELYGIAGRGKQWDMTTYKAFDAFTINADNGAHMYIEQFLSAVIKNYTYSGAEIVEGDRVLLTNQYDPKDNGIWIYNGPDNMITRATDANSPSKIVNAVVRVTDGIYKDTSWIMPNEIITFDDSQNWLELEFHPSSETIGATPIFGTRWQDSKGNPRFIDLQEDINIDDYDLICFMNYPANDDEVKEHITPLNSSEANAAYENFVDSLINAASNGSSMFVSSPKLAQDMKIVKKFTYVPQNAEDDDAQSAAINPFQPSEPASRYFDTHRNSKYQMVSVVPGLTDKASYILTDFINYIPEDEYSYEEWHVKYVNKPIGLEECCEFYIPGTSLRKISSENNIAGYRQNATTVKDLPVIAVNDILAGTQVSRLGNTYYENGQNVANPYHLFVSTLIVHNGQFLDGRPISGKIFVNCVEDGYIFSKEDYNKAYIQNFDVNDVNENQSTILWGYSTSRLNRKPKRANIAGIREEGQTVPTKSGGGPLIQSETASGNGIVRLKTDSSIEDSKTSLYREESEEVYTLTEIPTYSMTWLGLLWLIGQ